MKRWTLLLLLAAVIAMAAAATILYASPMTVHNEGAIHFGASINATTITQAQTVRVYLEDWNALSSKNSVPLGDGLRALNLSTGLCGVHTTGIAVYEGAYGLSNVSSASPLSFYAPSLFDCTGASITNSFNFEPLQNLTTQVDLVGYWSSGSTPQVGGGSSEGLLQHFDPGVYTVVAGDEWGNTKVIYFHVTATTGNPERKGPNSTFPASWLNPCNQSATGNLTTMVDLSLNSTSDFDHININQLYAQVLNSSSFAYRTLGHGWVVAEWYEIAGSSNEAGSVDQVIGYFILTSDGVPSGYIYAHYDLSSGTVAVTFTAATAPSCPT